MTRTRWLVLIAVAVIYFAAVAVSLLATGCGNPCDSRPGYEHPDTHHEQPGHQ
jgi:hypothetical protein